MFLHLGQKAALPRHIHEAVYQAGNDGGRVQRSKAQAQSAESVPGPQPVTETSFVFVQNPFCG